MKIKKERLLRISLILLLLFILIFQSVKAKEFFTKIQLLERQIEKQQLQNSNLKNKYLKTVKANNDKETVSNIGLKESTSKILAELKVFELKLIDFSSAQTELNLNINGSFHSILNFIYHLEIEMKQFEIVEFKIKNSNNDLFFYLKLKNELIENENNIF